MKKFVLMDVINNAFDDIEYVDYITVESVTDSMLSIKLHLKNHAAPKPDTKEFQDFSNRCLVLGKMLERKVLFDFSSESFFKRVLNFL